VNLSAGCCSHDGIGPVRIPGFPGRGISGLVNIPEVPGRGKLIGPKLLGGDGTGFEGCIIDGGFVKSVTSKTGAGGLDYHNLRVKLSIRMILK
jgi:hypothetical protein